MTVLALPIVPLVLSSWPVYGSRSGMTTPEPLESLMERYVIGDLQAFDEIYARVAPRVFKYLLSMTRDRARAEDLCQTVFLKLHRGRSGWMTGAPLLPWMMAIARNALYDDLLRSKRAKAQVTATGELPETVDLDVLDGEAALAAEQSSAEMAQALARAIEALPERQREALALTKQGGLNHREAALALGTTETAVKLRVHRAYEALRVALRGRKGGDA